MNKENENENVSVNENIEEKETKEEQVKDTKVEEVKEEKQEEVVEENKKEEDKKEEKVEPKEMPKEEVKEKKKEEKQVSNTAKKVKKKTGIVKVVLGLILAVALLVLALVCYAAFMPAENILENALTTSNDYNTVTAKVHPIELKGEINQVPEALYTNMVNELKIQSEKENNKISKIYVSNNTNIYGADLLNILGKVEENKVVFGYKVKDEYRVFKVENAVIKTILESSNEGPELLNKFEKETPKEYNDLKNAIKDLIKASIVKSEVKFEDLSLVRKVELVLNKAAIENVLNVFKNSLNNDKFADLVAEELNKDRESNEPEVKKEDVRKGFEKLPVISDEVKNLKLTLDLDMFRRTLKNTNVEFKAVKNNEEIAKVKMDLKITNEDVKHEELKEEKAKDVAELDLQQIFADFLLNAKLDKVFENAEKDTKITDKVKGEFKQYQAFINMYKQQFNQISGGVSNAINGNGNSEKNN